MATVSDVSAQNAFNDVETKFGSDGSPILTLLQDIASNSLVAIADTDAIPVATEPGFSLITTPDAPSEPAGAEVFTAATDYLDWLESQSLNPDVFPAYTEIITDAPEAPTANLGEITGRLSYVTPVAPNVVIPEWDDAAAWTGESALNDELSNPLIAPFSYAENTYSSPLIGRGGSNVLWDLVLKTIEDKDYGIDPNDEELLFERMREREARMMAGAMDGATRAFSTGGFTMPQGAMLSAINKIQIEARDKIASAHREQAIKRADMYVEARKVAIQNGLALDKQTMDFHNSLADRALKSILDGIQMTVSVAAHNLQRVKMFIDKYVAFAGAFEARVRASVAVVDLYKSQVDAEKGKAEVNRALVDEFVARNKAVIDTYVAQVEGFKAIVDNRVKYHGVLADFYKTKSSEIEYRARAMNGAYDLAEKSESNMVQFRIGKYNAEIAAKKNTLDSIVSALNAKIEQYKAQIQALTATAAAAMSGLNVNLGLSVSGSASISGSESVSESTSESTSTSTSDSTTKSTSTTTSDNHNVNDNSDLTKSTSEGPQDNTLHQLNT